MKLLGILLLLVGCGRGSFDMIETNQMPDVTEVISVELLPVVEKFENLIGKQIQFNLSLEPKLIDYKNGGFLDDDIVGVCWKSSNGDNRRVEIKEDAFNKMNKEAQEELIYHELGHCELDRGHLDTYFSEGCPKSIMNMFAFSDWQINNCYTPYKTDYYLPELIK